MDPDSGQMKNKISNPDPIKCKFLDPNPIGSGPYQTGSNGNFVNMVFVRQTIYVHFGVVETAGILDLK